MGRARIGGGRVTVFYDADCGFCTLSARAVERLDWADRVVWVPIRDAASAVPTAPPRDQLLQAMHALDDAGRWSRGGAAWLAIFDVVPLLRPLAIVGRLPLINRLVEPAYALVARNRPLISRLGLAARRGAARRRSERSP